MSIPITVISKRELAAYRADVKGSIFRQIRARFARLKEAGFTQKEWGSRIGMDEGQLSRRLRGDHDLQLETLSDLARGLDCRIDVTLTPLAEPSVAVVDDLVRNTREKVEQYRRNFKIDHALEKLGAGHSNTPAPFRPSPKPELSQRPEERLGKKAA